MNRSITLPLAMDTTETHCGKCRMNLGGCCVVHDERLKWGVQDGHAVVLRIPECAQAEAEHLAMGRDAEAWRRVRAAVAEEDRQRIIDTSGACPHLRLITERKDDPMFYPRTGCLDCNVWFGPVVCR